MIVKQDGKECTSDLMIKKINKGILQVAELVKKIIVNIMALSKESLAYFLNKDVVIFIEGRKLFGKLIAFNELDLTLSNSKFGISIRSIKNIDGIEVQRN